MVGSGRYTPVDEIDGNASVGPDNDPSFQRTRRPFRLVVDAGQCRPKILGIGSFCNHRSNPGTYRISWTILQSSLKAAHQVNPQRDRAASQEKIRTHSYPCISFSRCRRCSDLNSYCVLKLFNICPRKHDVAAKFDTLSPSTKRLPPFMREMFSRWFC